MVDVKLFEDVPLSSNEANPCSPVDPGESWEGILINAPQSVILEAGCRPDLFKPLEPIPVCGFYRVAIAGLGAGDWLVLTARDLDTDLVLVGEAAEADADSADAPPGESPFHVSPSPDGLSSDYFNLDLVTTLDLPAVPATYEVRAMIGSFVSNTVEIEVGRAEG